VVGFIGIESGFAFRKGGGEIRSGPCSVSLSGSAVVAWRQERANMPRRSDEKVWRAQGTAACVNTRQRDDIEDRKR